MQRVREGLVPAYLLLCLVLGGASAAGLWANMLLQLLAIPIILWALLGSDGRVLSPPARRLLLIAGIAIGLVAVQLIPLPPSMWTWLPGREAVAEGYSLLERELPWLPMSLAPHRTLASALWLLPALAVLLGALRLGFRRTWVGWAIVAVSALSLPLSLLQVTAGGFFYLYEISDFGLSTGLFANAAHMALLLVVALPILAALFVMVDGADQGGPGRQRLLVMLALLAVLIGLILSATLAAAALVVPVALGCLCLLLRRRQRLSGWWAAGIGLLAAGYIALASFTSFQNAYVWDESIGGPQSRHPALGASFSAAWDVFPSGSGLGTFADLYRTYEDSAAVGRLFLNHAHNDYVELLIETGLPGLALLIAFLAWWLRRTQVIWRSSEAGTLQRAATIATGALLVQSAAGYPLRTAALATVFAVCCALMARPRGEKKARTTSEQNGLRIVRHLSAD